MNTLFKVYKYVRSRMFEKLFKQAYGIKYVVHCRNKKKISNEIVQEENRQINENTIISINKVHQKNDTENPINNEKFNLITENKMNPN